MLQEVGYINGVKIKKFVTGETDVNIDEIQITLKGLEYLANNDTMKKVASVFVKSRSRIAEKLLTI